MSSKPVSSYHQVIVEAIATLKERTGSSQAAIKKAIETAHPDFNFQAHHFRSALKKGVAAGQFIMVKASYKLSAGAKKPTRKKKAAAKTAARKSAPKKPAANKPVA